jgi:hypothetical protein
VKKLIIAIAALVSVCFGQKVNADDTPVDTSTTPVLVAPTLVAPTLPKLTLPVPTLTAPSVLSIPVLATPTLVMPTLSIPALPALVVPTLPPASTAGTSVTTIAKKPTKVSTNTVASNQSVSLPTPQELLDRLYTSTSVAEIVDPSNASRQSDSPVKHLPLLGAGTTAYIGYRLLKKPKTAA